MLDKSKLLRHTQVMSNRFLKFQATECWEKQEGESNQAFEAFQLYRDMNSGSRSMAAVARKLGKTQQIIQKWGSEWDWIKRVDQFDRFLDSKRIEREVDKVTAMKDRQLDLAEDFFTLTTIEIKKLLDKAKKYPNKLILTPKDLNQLAKFATELERVILNEPKEIVEVTDRREKLRKLFESGKSQDALDVLNREILKG